MNRMAAVAVLALMLCVLFWALNWLAENCDQSCPNGDGVLVKSVGGFYRCVCSGRQE